MAAELVPMPRSKLLCTLQTLARVVEATERHYKAANRRSGLPLPTGPIEDRDHFRIWPKARDPSSPLCSVLHVRFEKMGSGESSGGAAAYHS